MTYEEFAGKSTNAEYIKFSDTLSMIHMMAFHPRLELLDFVKITAYFNTIDVLAYQKMEHEDRLKMFYEWYRKEYLE